MRKLLFFRLLACLCLAGFSGKNLILAQSKRLHVLSGIIRKSSTGERMEGVTVTLTELGKGTATNEKGIYQFVIPDGNYTLAFSYVGFKTLSKPVRLSPEMNAEVYVNALLEESTNELQQVEVYEVAPDRNVSETQMGIERLSVKTMKQLPTLLGEADIIRSLQLLPGVTTVGEGATGFNVRGGNTDQNLILLDNVPLFNSSHLFGFFTAVNPDVVKDVSLYKSGVPAQYGGRSSSVLAIRLREGDNQKFALQGGIGPTSARFVAEGPLWKGKTSFLIGGRGSWADPYLKLASSLEVKQSSAWFYDLNARLTHRFRTGNTLTLSGYYSRDRFRFPGDTAYIWQTGSVALRWDYVISSRLSFAANASASDYRYGINGLFPANEFTWRAGIQYQNMKAVFSYQPSTRYQLEAGAEATFNTLLPGKVTPASGSTVNEFTIASEHSRELAAFANYEWRIIPAVTLSAGVRYSFFQLLGPGTALVYDPNRPRNQDSVTDTLRYAKGAVIQPYSGFEPRFALNVRLSDKSAVKLSYNRMRQYLQLISNTTSITPLDVWKNSNAYLPPQITDQYSAGYFRNFKGNAYEASVEVFYKDLQNIVEYKDGADLFLNPANPVLEDDLLTGKGRAYGMEWLLRKNTGKMTGWVSYTYARTLRTVNGNAREEKINQGNEYPSNFDIPHTVRVVGIWQLSPRTSFSANFLYNTGRPVTYPVSRYTLNGGLVVPVFLNRNQARIPDYHRLDISFTFNGKSNKKWQNSWVVGIYNIYGRRNAYSIFFRTKNLIPESYKLSVLGSALPYVAYNFKF
jgi:hypothetical protein